MKNDLSKVSRKNRKLDKRISKYSPEAGIPLKLKSSKTERTLDELEPVVLNQDAEQFQGVQELAKIKELAEEPELLPLLLGMPVLLGGTLTGVALGLSDYLLADFGVGLLLLGTYPFIGSISWARRISKRAKRFSVSLGERISFWANQRYGIEIDETNLSILVEFLKKSKEQSCDFSDSKEDLYCLRRNAENTGFYIIHINSKQQELSIEQSLISLVPSNHTQLEEKVYALTNLIQILQVKQLIPEDEHVLNRVKQDALNALRTYADLFSSSNQKRAIGEPTVLGILHTLEGELKAVLDAETDALVSDLQTQFAYVQGRSKKLSLSLNADASLPPY